MNPQCWIGISSSLQTDGYRIIYIILYYYIIYGYRITVVSVCLRVGIIHIFTSSFCSEVLDTMIFQQLLHTSMIQISVSKHYLPIKGTKATWRCGWFQGWSRDIQEEAEQSCGVIGSNCSKTDGGMFGGPKEST